MREVKPTRSLVARLSHTLTITLCSFALTQCPGSTISVRPAPIAGAPAGAVGIWTEVRPAEISLATMQQSAKLQAIDDKLYLLAEGVLWRSDDHGQHFVERGRAPLSEFALFNNTILAWSENQSSPLYASRDDGLTFRGRPVETYSADHISSTGSAHAPVWLRAFAEHVFMVQPLAEDRLMMSASPPAGWREAELTLSAQAQADRASHNQSQTIRAQSIAQYGGRYWLCTDQGLFVGAQDNWTHTGEFSPPAYQQIRCKFADFYRSLCLAYNNGTAGTRLHCMDSNERWTPMDNGLLSPDALSNPATEQRAGMGYVTGTTELNGHYVLAQRSEPSLLPTLGGVFESENPRDGWTIAAARNPRRAQAVRSGSTGRNG